MLFMITQPFGPKVDRVVRELKVLKAHKGRRVGEVLLV
jgi:hypothetical protein